MKLSKRQALIIKLLGTQALGIHILHKRINDHFSTSVTESSIKRSLDIMVNRRILYVPLEGNYATFYAAVKK